MEIYCMSERDCMCTHCMYKSHTGILKAIYDVKSCYAIEIMGKCVCVPVLVLCM